jgi:hypothetical protein
MMKAKMMAGGGMMKKGYAAGGVAKEGEMMKKKGRGMAKADLQAHASKPASEAHAGLKKGGMTKAKMGPSKMGAVKTSKPSMGSASKRADGVAMKGKTKGVMLKKGGMCK